MSFSNYHTHTLYCDGKDSPEELVLEALRLGCPELGFSGHAHVPFDADSMSVEGTLQYKKEIRRLQEKYRDRITIYLGIEQDSFSAMSTEDYDYVIGSVHYVCKDGQCLPLDFSEQIQRRTAVEHFGGDYYALAEAYYEEVAQVYEKTHCQIVGHFDLITKYNEGNRLFDTAQPRYRQAALRALERLCAAPVIFEINTGAIARGYRSEAYPEPWLLRELEARGMPLLLSSDCHDKRDLLLGFEALQGCARGIQEKLYKNR